MANSAKMLVKKARAWLMTGEHVDRNLVSELADALEKSEAQNEKIETALKTFLETITSGE